MKHLRKSLCAVALLGTSMTATFAQSTLVAPADIGPTGSPGSDPSFSATVHPEVTDLNGNGWRGGVQIVSGWDGDNKAGALFFNKGNIASQDGNRTPATSHFFIGGPSHTPIGDYWIGMQENIATNAANLYSMQFVGNVRGNDPKLGSVIFHQDVLVRSTPLTNNVENRVGIGTLQPSVQLHTTSGVRFQGVAAQAASNHNRYLTIDNNGNVGWNSGGTGTGFTSNCASANYLLKSGGSNSANCSIVYDNGTSVSIGATSAPTYFSSGSYAQTSGAPANGTVSKFYVNGLTYTNSLVVASDARYKQNIEKIGNAMNTIARLRGVKYDWNHERFPDRNFDQFKQSGFIAQEVEQVYPEAVVKDENGYYAMNYSAIIPLLVEGTKEMYELYQAEKTRNDNLQSRLEQMERRLQQFELKTTGVSQESPAASILNITPNPVNSIAAIDVEIVNDFRTACIVIHDNTGRECARLPVSGKGKNVLSLSAIDMKPGVYVCSLNIDGNQVASRKFMIEK